MAQDPRTSGLSLTGKERAARANVVVDTHNHVVSAKVEAAIAAEPQKLMERQLLIDSLGESSVLHNESMMSDLTERLTNAKTRIADMDSMGVDMQILSPSPTQYYYWADRDISHEVVGLQNELIAEMTASNPHRFAGIGALSLQFPDLAVRQLDECVKKYGFRGVEIGSVVNGKEISDSCFAPFWSKAEELGIVVFIHPLGTSLGKRTDRYYLANLIGQPIEISLAISHLILGGVLDKYPGLKILAAHGGGYLGLCRARLNHGWLVRPESRSCKFPPDYYLDRIYFDTAIHSALELGRLIQTASARNLMLGTDYPFDMGVKNPLKLLNSVDELANEAKAMICGGNAIELFGLRVP